MLIDLERLDPGSLPLELAISAVTLAELAAGPHANRRRGRRRGGRKERGRRALELLIAATAIAAGLPLSTRDAADFVALDELVELEVVD